jgi:hypothetical protein
MRLALTLRGQFANFRVVQPRVMGEIALSPPFSGMSWEGDKWYGSRIFGITDATTPLHVDAASRTSCIRSRRNFLLDRRQGMLMAVDSDPASR